MPMVPVGQVQTGAHVPVRCSPERDADITRRQLAVVDSLRWRWCPTNRRLWPLIKVRVAVAWSGTPRTPREYRCVARWWELEAARGYESSPASQRDARNMRWAAELAGLFGPGTWAELLARSGHPNPETTAAVRSQKRGA